MALAPELMAFTDAIVSVLPDEADITSALPPTGEVALKRVGTVAEEPPENIGKSALCGSAAIAIKLKMLADSPALPRMAALELAAAPPETDIDVACEDAETVPGALTAANSGKSALCGSAAIAIEVATVLGFSGKLTGTVAVPGLLPRATED
jgi:hypothetical protein